MSDDWEGSVFCDIRYDPDATAPNYVGKCRDKIGDEKSPMWLIYKYTYNNKKLVRVQRTRGSWEARVKLFT